MKILLLTVIFMLLSYVVAEQARSITIQNDSGTNVEIYWIDPSTGEGFLQSSPYIHDGAAFSLNSFIDHSFEAREMPGKGGSCLGKEQTCRTGYFTVNKNDDQQVFIDSEFNIEHQDNKSIQDDERKIIIQNDSGTKVEIYWINPSTGEGFLQSSPYIHNGATFRLNSFIDHSFEAREMPGKGGSCLGKEQTCRIGYFTVNKNDDQQVFIDSEFNVKHQDNKSIARESAAELLNDCEKQIQADSETESWTTAEAISELKKCVASGVADEVEKANKEIAFQTQIRKAMAKHWENYTCADYDLETSDAVREEVWDHDDQEFEVQVLLDQPASKIHVVKNFITEEECAAMEEHAKPKLKKATIADGKGGSELSPIRKAMQAGIRIPWNLEEEGHPLTTISRRVYGYTNHVLGMDIEEHGQEDLVSIQYEGRGEDDETPDRYMPHCDGDCNGMQHKMGDRMATMVMYCTVPEKGGATNFMQTGVHVVPEAGSATFFSYIDPETMKMDNGFTVHSGCPVIAGEKKIVTQWVRYGVDAENPWDSFNTLGIKISAEDD